MKLNPQTLKNGQEQHEMFRPYGRPHRSQPMRCMYDYRHTNGKLFSCVAPSLKEARAQRDAWLQDPANWDFNTASLNNADLSAATLGV